MWGKSGSVLKPVCTDRNFQLMRSSIMNGAVSKGLACH